MENDMQINSKNLFEEGVFQKQLASVDSPPASPYSKHRQYRTGIKTTDVHDDGYEGGGEDEIVIVFESHEGSPYSRRYPAGNKINRPTEDDDQIRIQNPGWTPSFTSDNDLNTIKELQDFSLPVELHRFHSMQSLRNRRDPHYQGVRSRRPKRVIFKSGDRNIGFIHIPEKSRRFFKDFVTTLIEEQWRYVITVFALSFFVCWILFAALWYLIAHAHGDLTFDKKTGQPLSDGPVPCVEGARTFAGFLLYSIETQVSIGFGDKYPNEECPEAIFLMVVQIIIGIAIEGAMVGIVYAKMVRPSKQSGELKFSKKAVVCQRDSTLCLLFRVSDTNELHVVESKICAYWFEEKHSMEGEVLRQFHHRLKLENDGKLFLIFPLTVCHVIDASSPLYDLSAKDLLEKKFEIVITLTGSSRSTGQIAQEKTSYLPREIMWGHRFENIVHYNKSNEGYVADFEKFDNTYAVDTPLCSAKRLDEVVNEVNDYFESPEFLDETKLLEEKLTDVYSNDSNIFKYNENDDKTRMTYLATELQIRLSQYSLHAEAELRPEKIDSKS